MYYDLSLLLSTYTKLLLLLDNIKDFPSNIKKCNQPLYEYLSLKYILVLNILENVGNIYFDESYIEISITNNYINYKKRYSVIILETVILRICCDNINLEYVGINLPIK